MTQWQGSYKVGPYCCIGMGLDEHPQETLIIGDEAHIRSHTVIYYGCRIGSHFATGHHVMIREYTQIGDRVSIGTSSVIEHRVVIENDVRVHSRVFVPEFTILEEGCWIGPGVVLTNARYPLSIDVKTSLKGPRIGAKAKIGANATILPGITVGKGALVGAGAVVTKDVPDYAVVVGNPARVINHLSNLPYPEFICEKNPPC